MSDSSGEKTEKATPQKRAEARKQGTVAKSMDINGSVVLVAGLATLVATTPLTYGRLQAAMHDGFAHIADPSIVDRSGIGVLFAELGVTLAWTIGPVAFASLVAGVIASVVQVKWKPSAQAIKPQPAKLNPIAGAKNIYGPRAGFELVKNLLKVSAIGAVLFYSIYPELDELAALVGMPPAQLMSELAVRVMKIGFLAGAAYFVIGIADYLYSRYEVEKQLKMSKEDVKQEFKNSEVSAEVKGAIKRRQMESARARMMDEVPQADVVVTNPTHYSVALRYSPDNPAPVVVAKGKDIIAFRIRELAAEHGVPVIPDPPLARSLHASVEVGRPIPEELFQAVAQLLAHVYRVAGRRRALNAGAHAA